MDMIFGGISLCKDTFIHDTRSVTSMIYQEKLFTHNRFYLKKKYVWYSVELVYIKRHKRRETLFSLKKWFIIFAHKSMNIALKLMQVNR